MKAEDLTREQLETLVEQTARHLRYLVRLCERMKMKKWPPEDPLMVAAEDAREYMSRLHVHLHGWLTGSSRAGRPTR
jgi:hypothetical protein